MYPAKQFEVVATSSKAPRPSAVLSAEDKRQLAKTAGPSWCLGEYEPRKVQTAMVMFQRSRRSRQCLPGTWRVGVVAYAAWLCLQVASEAVRAGASIVNDVSGGGLDPAMHATVRSK